MQNYFISHSEPRERGLREANIPFERFRMERQDGLVFEDRYLQQALTALNSQIEREDGSSYDGIRILYLHQSQQRAGLLSRLIRRNPGVRVSLQNRAHFSSDENRNLAVSIARELGPQFVGVQEIVLTDVDSRSNPIPPQNDPSKLAILLWAAPRGRAQEDQDAASHLWGHRISDSRGYWVIYLPSGQGEIIRDPEGAEVAEVVGNNIYILYPLTDNRIRTFDPIFRKILEEALALRGTPEERAERQRQQEERLREEVRTNPVAINHWTGSSRYRGTFTEVAKEFAQVFGKPIRLHDYSCCCEQVSPYHDGRMHVFIFASAGSTSGDGRMQSKLFGAPLKSEDNSQSILRPTGEEGELIIDEDGNQVGQIVGDNIYIHYPLVRPYLKLKWDGKGPDALFRRMLEEAAFWKAASEEQKSARARAMAERHRVQSREEYVRACNGRFDKALESTRKALRDGPEEVRELQEQLVKKIREQTGLQRKLSQMESARPSAVEVYGKEFDKLLQVPKIRDVRVHDGVIRVFTDTLYCIDPRTKKKHEIGHFRIEIHPNGQVRWFNLARRVSAFDGNGMQAPHVFPDGKACLGNASEVIPELAANYEFAALAMVCIQFVESVNVNDPAGKHVDKWPIAA